MRFSLASGALTALLWVTSTDPIRHVRDTLNALPTFGEQLQRQGPAHAEFVGVFLFQFIGGGADANSISTGRCPRCPAVSCHAPRHVSSDPA